MTDQRAPSWFSEILATLLRREELNAFQVRAVLHDLMAGHCPEVEAAALLVAWRMKGETGGEIAAAAQMLREHMVRFETGRTDLLDTCGTGGDETGTFNISTATAIVVAGAGVPVVKHGNRAVSSRSGSIDVLAALGVEIRDDCEWNLRCLARAGLAFCSAPHFHPALRHIAPVRQRLGFRTIFNCLGPLANPAGAQYQLLGIGRPEWLEPMAQAMAQLGIRRAFLVCGRDGLDEVSLSGPTQVREVRGHEIISHEWQPADFGLEPCRLVDLQVNGPEASAALIGKILEGQGGPAGRVVIANAATALLAADRVPDLPTGVARATEVLRLGKALGVLQTLRACTIEPRGGSSEASAGR